MVKRLLFLLVVGMLMTILVGSCATTKKSTGVLASDLEIIIIEPSGNSTIFYPARFDTAKGLTNKQTTFYFYDGKNKIYAQKTIVPGTRVLFNDYSLGKEKPKSWRRDWIK